MHRAGLVPIILGVTGHRDVPLTDRSILLDSIKSILDQFKAKYPSSPLLLISSLAEGADRLAAQAALNAGWLLGVSLPMIPEEFEKDFSGEKSIQEFRSLCESASWVRVDSLANRPQCYVEASGWMAAHAQYLLALWDGQPNGGACGTADTVRVFLEGVSSQRLTLPDSGPVMQLLTRRESSLGAVPEDQVGHVTIHAPRPGGFSPEGELERWASILDRIDDFNRDACNALNLLPEQIQKSRGYLNGGKPPEGIPPAAESASWLHAVADQISFSTQKQRNRHFQWLIVGATMAIFFELLYSGPFAYFWVIALALISGFAAIWAYRHGVGLRLENRYIDYRALAEACRVQYFWQLAEILDSVADHYLKDQRDELEWIRQAVLTTELVSNHKPIQPADPEYRLQQVRDCWIEDQRQYFLGTSEQAGKADFNARMNDRFDWWVLRLIVLGVGILVFLTLFHAVVAPALGDLGDNLIQALIVSYGMTFASAGLLKVYQETKTYSEQAQSYRRAGLSMSLARNHLDASLQDRNWVRARAVIREAGVQALDENNDWLIVHRERPVKVPIS